MFNKVATNEENQEKIRKVMESAKNSEYYHKEEQKIREYQQKVRRYKSKITALKYDAQQWKKIKDNVTQLVETYKKERIITRTWIHIDMDMFFAAVEIRDNPSLKGMPVAVGNNSMIQTTNYLAREQGVSSGMPGFIGKKLCP